jgi:hypothetical protein
MSRGERALYVSPGFLKRISGVTPRESQLRLELLWESTAGIAPGGRNDSHGCELYEAPGHCIRAGKHRTNACLRLRVPLTRLKECHQQERMMSVNLAAIYRRTVFIPFAAMRQRLHHHANQPAAEVRPEDAASHDDPERLERIAMYARAGYFNMGYTLDSFHMMGEIDAE